ncbi:MAG: calcium-binding protein [Sulfitobacter sp.]|nr:calcium-binding protein [Sulfitobacter sp.]
MADANSITPSPSFDAAPIPDATIWTQDDTFWSASETDGEFFGGQGDDYFAVYLSGGADTFDGGTGEDRIHYYQQVRVDLENPERNTNTAADDTITNIETLIGSRAGADNLSGDSAANMIIGDIYSTAPVRNTQVEWAPTLRLSQTDETDDVALMGDWLWGRGGNDTLFGGAGRDVLYGGAGADLLDGGTQFDTARYSDWQSVTVDLANGALNTNEAAGDRFLSIERIIATAHNDVLRGDAGDDILRGGDGDDFLHGQDGRDTLAGGGDDDTLRGGQGGHVFIYNHGNDVIEDFADNVDRLLIDQTHLLIGDRDLSGMAEVVGGNTVLTFANGHRLTLLGVTDPDSLMDDITII